MIVMAIDPGNAESAWCVIRVEDLCPVHFGKDENEAVLDAIREHEQYCCKLVIERVASYGMAVGREVFETCEWVGRFTEAASKPSKVDYIYRRDEKLHICGDSRAKDTNIRRALIDRFSKTDLRNGKGTKEKPDWFFGFKADIWAAYAVGLTYIETVLNKEA